MRYILEEYGGAIIAGIVAMTVAIMFYNLYPDIAKSSQDYVSPDTVEVKAQDNSELSKTPKPILVAKSAILNKGDTFDYMNYVRAYDSTGQDITDHVTIVGDSVDTSHEGKYTITYKCLYNRVASYTTATYIVDY